VNGRAPLHEQIDDTLTVPVQRLFQRGPVASAPGTIDGRAAVQQQRGSCDVVAAGAGAERPIHLRAGIYQDAGHIELVGRPLAVEDQALQQGRITR